MSPMMEVALLLNTIFESLMDTVKNVTFPEMKYPTTLHSSNMSSFLCITAPYPVSVEGYNMDCWNDIAICESVIEIESYPSFESFGFSVDCIFVRRLHTSGSTSFTLYTYTA